MTNRICSTRSSRTIYRLIVGRYRWSSDLVSRCNLRVLDGSITLNIVDEGLGLAMLDACVHYRTIDDRVINDEGAPL